MSYLPSSGSGSSMAVMRHGQLWTIANGQPLVVRSHALGVRLELCEGVANVEGGAVEQDRH